MRWRWCCGRRGNDNPVVPPSLSLSKAGPCSYKTVSYP